MCETCLLARVGSPLERCHLLVDLLNELLRLDQLRPQQLVVRGDRLLGVLQLLAGVRLEGAHLERRLLAQLHRVDLALALKLEHRGAHRRLQRDDPRSHTHPLRLGGSHLSGARLAALGLAAPVLDHLRLERGGEGALLGELGVGLAQLLRRLHTLRGIRRLGFVQRLVDRRARRDVGALGGFPRALLSVLELEDALAERVELLHIRTRLGVHQLRRRLPLLRLGCLELQVRLGLGGAFERLLEVALGRRVLEVGDLSLAELEGDIRSAEGCRVLTLQHHHIVRVLLVQLADCRLPLGFAVRGRDLARAQLGTEELGGLDLLLELGDLRHVATSLGV